MALSKSDVSALYVAIFNRASEGEGNTYWQTVGTAAEVADAMLETAPAKEYFGAALDSDEDFIAHIYLNTLGKTAEQDPEGIAYWVGELATQSRGEVIARLIESALDPVHEGTDAQNLFKNMVAVSDYAADTIEEAPEDLSVLRFDEGLKGVTADEASVDAAKTKVDQVLNPVDPVVAALEELRAAEKAVDDFLFDIAQDDEVEGDEPPATRADLEAARDEAVAALEGNAFAEDAGFDADDSAALQKAKLDAAKLAAAEEVADAQAEVNKANAEIAKVTGLAAALSAVEARTSELAAAQKAELAADAGYEAALASYNTLFAGAAVPVATDDKGNFVVNPAITNAAQKAEAAKVVAARIAQEQAANATQVAGAALEEAVINAAFVDSVKGDKDALFDAVAGKAGDTEGRGDALTYADVKAAIKVAEGKIAAAEEADDTTAAEAAQAQLDAINDALADVIASGTPRGEALADAQGVLKDAQDAEKGLLDAIAARDAAEGTLAQLKQLEDAVTAAEKVLEELDVELVVLNDDVVAVAATAGDDFFVAAGANASIYNFGLQGEDKIFIGSDYTLNTGALNTGDDSALEVFFIQNGNNTDVYLETKAYGSSEAGVPEVVITLAGVTATDLSLTEDGFVTVA